MRACDVPSFMHACSSDNVIIAYVRTAHTRQSLRPGMRGDESDSMQQARAKGLHLAYIAFGSSVAGTCSGSRPLTRASSVMLRLG